MIVDEAKTVPDSIFDAIARCQPSRLLVMSSPGASAGAFYEAFTKQRKSWDTFTVTAFDCPHITQRWIDEQTEIYGEDSPLIRSMIYGEFYDDTGDGLVISLKSLEACLQNPPPRQAGMRVAFVDFAAGGDECVFALREGNKVTEMVTWRDKDTNRTLGKGYRKGDYFLCAIDPKGNYLAFDHPNEIEGIAEIGYRTMVDRFIIGKVKPYYEVANWDMTPLLIAMDGKNNTMWI